MKILEMASASMWSMYNHFLYLYITFKLCYALSYTNTWRNVIFNLTFLSTYNKLPGWQQTFRSASSQLAVDLNVSCQPAGSGPTSLLPASWQQTSPKIIFQEKIKLDIPCELAVYQIILMKCEALYWLLLYLY